MYKIFNLYPCTHAAYHAISTPEPVAHPLRPLSVPSPTVHRLFNGLNRRTIVEQPVNSRRRDGPASEK